MKFIIFVIDGPNNPASPNEIEKIDAFNDLLRDGGHWVTAAGIVGPERATLIDNRGEKGEVQSASLFNSKEYYSGFWLVEANTEEDAKKLALAGSLACNRKVELRPYLR
ncbi:MAG: hypothetical protein EBW33_04775 [Actinobacteria bacterium]|nr:hypothetical protein [Actinomycetota bacterium]